MKKLLIIISLLTSSTAFTCSEDGKSGFMPENNMSISADSKMRNDMTEEQFNAIIDKVVKHYKPIAAKKRKILKIARKWKDKTVNANARQLGFYWLVNMYGGLARHPVVTDDAFALVVCHELGHLLGGAPKIGGVMKWASNEGQADYFGSMKCFRRVYINDNNAQIISTMTIPTLVNEKCEQSFTNENEVSLCVRASMAGKSLAKLLGGGRATVDFNTPDTAVVGKTNNRHPAAQCRLDTYFQGSLCDKEFTNDVSDKDANVGVCNRRDNDTVGIRPLCWYKPQS